MGLAVIAAITRAALGVLLTVSLLAAFVPGRIVPAGAAPPAASPPRNAATVSSTAGNGTGGNGTGGHGTRGDGRSSNGKYGGAAPFTGYGSIGQAYLIGGRPGTAVVLTDARGRAVGRGTIDPLGALIVRGIRPGGGYTFRTMGRPVLVTTPFRVLSPSDVPTPSFYSGQHLSEGLNYLTMRDGVRLAATVRLPPGKTLADGPFPTVIEESGYAIAAPHSLIDAIFGTNGESLSDPLVPDAATAVGSVLAPLLGFATVSLQMRGTGCSGGAFDLFGLPTTYDGYDAVQAVAAQPWVLGHRVGMVGISFSGISQMFVAGTRPPGLAAIAPLSLTDDLYSTGFPGGLFNTGFAATWLEQRIQDAMPAPQGGQEWAKVEIADGDRTCLANQALHDETQNLSSLLEEASHYAPSLYVQRAPATWARRVQVPVFVSGAFQDEQTGGQWPAIIADLAKDPHVFATIVNGTHVDSLGPGTIVRWVEFLDIFVADRVPSLPPEVVGLAPVLYTALTSAPTGALPPLQYGDEPSVAAARAAFERQERVRVLFDNGGGSAGPGAMQPVWSHDFASWPPPGARATTLDLRPDGSLAPTAPSPARVSFRPDPSARPATDLAGGANPWAATPPYQWAPVSGSDGLAFVSPPLRHDLAVVGPASLNLWVSSTASDTDLQGTISEVRPGGQEMFVNSGVLRASDRALDPRASTATHPVPTYSATTARPLPAGRFSEVRIPIVPFAYVFRAGSRIRLTISAPGGDRPVWAFGMTYQTKGSVIDTLSLGGRSASALVLSVVPGLRAPDAQPGCPSLRGQPCRAYAPAADGG